MIKDLYVLLIFETASILLLAHTAYTYYKDKTQAEARLKQEITAVYDMQFLNYQKDKELEKLHSALDSMRLCDIILTQKI